MPQDGPAQQIRFTVRKASPALPGFPASELEVQSVNTRGFQTSCAPAEIILELVGGGRFDLSQLQILSHESKIARRIEVSVLVVGTQQFQILGFMEFEDNSRSGYLARELQSVRVTCSDVLQVRLVLHRAHLNAQLNPENHVGIIGMNILGWKRQHDVASVPQTVAAVAPALPLGEANRTHSESVTALLKRVEELKAAKEDAVAREAYEDALQLKNEELEARRLAELAQDLERSKQEAVMREDYEEAQRIKAKMEDLLNPGKRRATTTAAAVHTTPTSSHHRHTPASASNSSLHRTSSSSMSADKRSPFVPASTSPPVPALLAKQHQQQPQQQAMSREEGAPEGFWKGKAKDLVVAEPLEPSLKASDEVRSMNQAFGTYFSRCLYSAHYELRVAVLDKLVNEVEAEERGKDDAELDAILFAASVGLNEPNSAEIFSRAARLVNLALDRAPAERTRHNPCFEHTIFPRLLDALVAGGEHAQPVMAGATRLFQRLCGADLFGFAFAVKLITTQTSKRGATLWKPFLARLRLLIQLASQSSPRAALVEEDACELVVLEWMKSNALFTHANEKIQHACLELVTVLASRAGGRVRGEMRDFLQAALRPNQFAQYSAAMLKSAPTSPASSSAPAAAVGPSRTATAAIASSLSQCVFCGKSNLHGEDEMDLHMWRDCAMLASCPHCNQVVEISKLNDHLLRECEHRANHRACPRCHEAIAVPLWEKHVKRNLCLVAKPLQDANRCPLCHNDIYPREAGWRTHLLRDLCPNNARTASEDGD